MNSQCLTLLSSISSFKSFLLLRCGMFQINSLIASTMEKTDIGLGIRLNGTGSLQPCSKYENQSLARANFHSTSASPCTNREKTGREKNQLIKLYLVISVIISIFPI